MDEMGNSRWDGWNKMDKFGHAKLRWVKGGYVR